MTQATPRGLKKALVPQTVNVITLSRSVPESASGVVPLDQLESPVVRRGVDYWLKLRGSRPYPSRDEIVPRELAGLLRHVVLVRLIDAITDYEYRIVGDAHVISHGFNMQGLRVSDVDAYSPGYGPVLKKLYDRAVRRRDAYAFRGWLERGDQQKKYIYSESVFMPLGPDNNTIDHVLNFSVYIPRERFDV
jgi:hypothetical protein